LAGVPPQTPLRNLWCSTSPLGGLLLKEGERKSKKTESEGKKKMEKHEIKKKVKKRRPPIYNFSYPQNTSINRTALIVVFSQRNIALRSKA